VATNESKHRGSSRNFTPGELVRIQQQWYNNTGEWIKDEDIPRLQEVGVQLAGSVKRDDVKFTDRAKWRESIWKEKLEKGLIKKSGHMNTAIADTGTSYLRKIVAHYAKDDECKAQNRYAIAASHMRPLKEDPNIGLVCREMERKEVKASILYFVHAKMSKNAPTGDGNADATPTNDDQLNNNYCCDVAFE
jgi:hypothetical protein